MLIWLLTELVSIGGLAQTMYSFSFWEMKRCVSGESETKYCQANHQAMLKTPGDYNTERERGVGNRKL